MFLNNTRKKMNRITIRKQQQQQQRHRHRRHHRRHGRYHWFLGSFLLAFCREQGSVEALLVVIRIPPPPATPRGLKRWQQQQQQQQIQQQCTVGSTTNWIRRTQLATVEDTFSTDTTTTTSSTTTTTTTTTTTADRFHRDMIRVLELRRCNNNEKNDTTGGNDGNDGAGGSGGRRRMAKTTFLDRKNRPPIVTHDVDGAERVLQMLHYMMELGIATEPSFQIVMKAFLQRGRTRWKVTPSSSLSSLSDGTTTTTTTSATTTTTNSAGGGGVAVVTCAADQLELLLQQLQQYDPLYISKETYNLVLEAYAICSTPRGNRNYAQRAHNLLVDTMMMTMDNQDNHHQHPDDTDDTTSSQYDVMSMVHVLHAWAWQQANLSPSDCGAQQAQEWLEQLEEYYYHSSSPTKTIDSHILMQCYDWVLEAWSKSNSKGSANKAMTLLTKMKNLTWSKESLLSLSSTNDTTTATATTVFLLPNAETYANAILAWTKQKEEEDQDSVQRAHELLLEMIQKYKEGALLHSEPPLIAFHGCITAWARLGRPDMAESILWKMEQLRPFCTKLVPTVRTYNSVLHAHVQSQNEPPHSTKIALSRILEIVDFMESHCTHDQQPAIQPDEFTYHTVIRAWTQSGKVNAAEQAEQILATMERHSLNVTTRSFNLVINAYAKTATANPRAAAQRALQLLDRMEQQSTVYANHDLEPDVISYTSVLECLSKSSQQDADVVACMLLDRALARYESTGNVAVRPNARTFTMAILALSKCPKPGTTQKARALLTRLVDLYETTHPQDASLRPNEYPYNYVLNCAANTLGTLTTKEKLQAFQLALQTFQEMRALPHIHPDSFTYAFWIKACNNLLPPGDIYNKCVRLAFEDCKANGLLTKEVVQRLKQGHSMDLTKLLLAESTIDVCW